VLVSMPKKDREGASRRANADDLEPIAPPSDNS
jgi:hypothetical protein